MSTGEPWTLGHRPALDGLRGVAVLLVIVSHIDGVPLPRLQVGQVGVSVFFTLSGFLIASLLLEERASTGRINLRAFYIRRARRLVPALAAFLMACGLLATSAGARFATPTEVLAAATYWTNWLAVMAGGPDGALSHTWSLAVEEQFYIVAPLLLIAVASRRRLLFVVSVAVAASLVTRLLLAGDMWRVVHGADTRAGELLAGVLLAVVLHGSQLRVASRAWVPVGLAAIAAACVLSTAVILGAGLLVVSAGTCAVVYGVTHAPAASRLESPVLLWLGRRSYGLYLWHYPVAFVLNAAAPASPWQVRCALVVALAVGTAALSWRYVEEPFLRRRLADADPVAGDLALVGGCTGQQPDLVRVGDEVPEVVAH